MIYNGFVLVDSRDNTGTESNYDTPTYGPYANPSAPLPGLGGQGWNNPPATGKTDDKVKIKALCGQQPLLNINGSKDKYQECAQKAVTPQQQQVPVYVPTVADSSMSTGVKILIGSLIFIVLLAIVLGAIYMSKRGKTSGTSK